MSDGWPERFHPLWDFSGNTKVIGSWYLAVRRGKGAGWPVQRTWLNEASSPYRYGKGVGLRLPRLLVSVGRWDPISQLRYADMAHDRVAVDISGGRTLSSQSGGGTWDRVLADS